MERNVVKDFEDIKQNLANKQSMLAIANETIVANKVLSHNLTKTKIIEKNDVLILADIKIFKRKLHDLYEFVFLTKEGFKVTVYCTHYTEYSISAAMSKETQNIFQFLKKIKIYDKKQVVQMYKNK